MGRDEGMKVEESSEKEREISVANKCKKKSGCCRSSKEHGSSGFWSVSYYSCW